jgi:hypothetical protein
MATGMMSDPMRAGAAWFIGEPGWGAWYMLCENQGVRHQALTLDRD